MNQLIKFCTSILLFLILFSGQLQADWYCRSDSALPISISNGNQWNVRLVSDQKNGAIFVWQDRRNGLSGDKLYIQRVSSNGNPLWQLEGIRLVATDGYQYYPQIISDGKSGAFIVWQDNRSGNDYDIYIQRVDANGNSMWTPNGTLVCGAQGHQYYPQIVSDGSSGAIVTWQDRRNGQFDIYAQKYDSLGQAKWSANGEPVCTDTSNQIEPKLINDYHGGAVIAWADYRLGTGSTDIYCQRILSNGQAAWAHDGVPICTAQNTQWNIQIVPDSTGGAIIAWQDRRNWTYDNIYAQRIDPFGSVRWAVNGIQLAQYSGTQYYPQMVSDRSGGAIIIWQDNRRGTDYDIYGQRVSREGTILWTTTGIPICTALGNQYYPQIILQGSSFIVTWQDRRGIDYDIYAQRLNLSGQPFWSVDGVPVSTYQLDQFMPQLASDSLNGAIIAWADYRLNNGSTDIFAHRIGANGLPGGGCFRTFIQDSLGLTAKRIVNQYKRIIAKANAGNVRDSIYNRGIFPYGITIGIERWDFPKNYGWQRYNRTYAIRRAFPQTWQARPFDWTDNHQRIVGEMKNPPPSRYNNKLVGELLALKLNIAASDVSITPNGLGDLIFKDSVQSNPLNNKKLRQLVCAVDSMLTMWMYFTNTNYKQICTTLERINWTFDGKYDTLSTIPLRINATRPLFSSGYLKPSPDPPTVVPEFKQLFVSDDIPEEFVLQQNYPNPFNPITTIEFSIPEPSIVTMKIYNILGQDVSVPIDHILMDGDQQYVDFDASNLSSGVYFYQLVAEPLSKSKILTQVKKMMVLK